MGYATLPKGNRDCSEAIAPLPISQDKDYARRYWLGVAGWVGFSLLALALRGIRWDEDLEFAQAMTGLVPYPDGHPLPQYTRAAYNAQFYSTALLLWLTRSDAVVCGFRNLLFIVSTVLPMYMLAATLSRRVSVGCIATALFLAGIHLEFDGSYPQFLWPGMFSNGHIGVGYTLIVLALFAGGYARAAALAVGLMPCIHLGQMAPMLLLGGAYTIALWWIGSLATLRKILPWFFGGLAVCLVFLLIQRSFVLPPPDSGPYAARGDVQAIWEGRLGGDDMHRSIPVGNSHVVAGGILLLGLMAFAAWPASLLRDSTWRWVLAYALCVLAVVYGIIAIHLIARQHTPYLLLGWLPYRLSNHLSPILIAAVISILLAPKKAARLATSGSLALAASLAFILIKDRTGALIGENFYSRYLKTTDSVFFFLYGAALGLLFLAAKDWYVENPKKYRRRFMGVLAVNVAGIVALCAVHQFGAACVTVGWLSMVALTWIPRLSQPSASMTQRILGSHALCLTLGALLVTSILWSEYTNREHLPVGAFEEKVADYLDEQGDTTALLVAGPHQLLLQAQTGHPVMADMATSFHSSYMPSLGPSIQGMLEPIYGIRLERPAEDPAPASWTEVWEARSSREWRELGDHFSFKYVIAPRELELDLRLLFVGSNDALYARRP